MHVPGGVGPHGSRPRRPRTLVEMLEGLDSEDRGLTFIEAGKERFLSFATLGARSRELGAKFSGLGLRKGDPVVMVVASQAEFIQLFLAALRIGVVPAPLYPPFILGELDAYLAGLRRVLAITGARTLLTSAVIVPMLEGIDPDIRCLTLDDVEAAEEVDRPVAVRPDDLAFLQFTSGSTAAPKGVMVPHRTLIENAVAIGDHLGVSGDGDRGVCWLPLYHDFGLIGFTVTPMLRQASVWYLAPLDFARDPTSWPELIHRVGGTVSSAPNFGYELLARRATDEQVERWDLSAWRVAFCGAETIRPQTFERFAERLAPAGFSSRAFLPCYGLAEATLAVSLWSPAEEPRAIEIDAAALRERGSAVLDDVSDPVEVMSCGSPLPGLEVAILDSEGLSLPERQEGEIVLRGPSVTDGYFANAEATAAVFVEGGWLHTGDLGFLHDGEIFPTSRKKDLIVVAGRNYHPPDIEWCAGEDPGVRGGGAIAFAAVGKLGEEAVLVVEARPDIDEEELRRRLARRVRARLGLTLKEVVVVRKGGLPKTSSGKPRRAALRGHYENGDLMASGAPV